MRRVPQQWWGSGGAAVATVAWALGGVLVKLATADGLSIAVARLWLGAAVMLVVLTVAGRRLTWSGVRASLLGGVFFGADIALFFLAVKSTSIADASFIGALQPALLLLVVGRWFGERVGLREVAWTALAVGGVGVVVAGSTGVGTRSLLGDLLAVGALLAWTAYFVASKRARETLGAIEYMTAVLLVGATAVTPVALLAGSSVAPLGARDWLLVGVLVVVPGLGGHLTMNWAHRYVALSVSSVIGVAQPVLAALVALVVLGEPLTGLQVLGGALAVAGIAGVVRRSVRAPVSLASAAAGQDQEAVYH